jgi:ubiquinone/menaquinone biosynthesis C-methylase UbiE
MVEGNQYKDIAEEYANNADKSVGGNYLWNYTFFQVIGNVKNKSVLDLACGDGFLTRQLKKKGASNAIGVDLSPEMIKIAEEKEKKNPLGITYDVGKVGELKKVGEFDLVVAGFLLHYSETEEELLQMCKDIYKNMKKGGRFFTINRNPLSPLGTHGEYGSTCETEGELKNGSKLKITLFNEDKKVCSFYNFHWSKETYEKCLKAAGFSDIKWHAMEVSPDGIVKFGKEFWNEWYANPYLIVLEATKA